MNNIKEVLVLAGGLGTRLQSVVSNIPKALAPIAGRPFLSYLLRYLSRNQVQRVVLSTGVGANHIEDFLKTEKFPFEITTMREAKPLGTGGAIQFCLTAITQPAFFIINGDTILDGNLDQIYSDHMQTQASVTIGSVRVPDAKRYGRIKASASHQVLGFEEKGSSGPGLINGGIILTNQSIFKNLSKKPPFSFETDILPPLVEAGQVYSSVCKGFFLDIGIPEDYSRGQTLIPEWDKQNAIRS